MITAFDTPEFATVDASTSAIGDVLTFTNGGPLWQPNTLANLDGVRLGNLQSGQILVEADNHLEALDAFDFTAGSRASYTFDFTSTPASFTLTAANLMLDDPAGEVVTVNSFLGSDVIDGATPALRAVQFRNIVNVAIGVTNARDTWQAAVSGNTVIVLRQINGLITEQSQSTTTIPANSLLAPTFTSGVDNTYTLTSDVAPVPRTWQGSNTSVTSPSATGGATNSVIVTIPLVEDLFTGANLSPITSLAAGTYRITAGVTITSTSATNAIRATFGPEVAVGTNTVIESGSQGEYGQYYREEGDIPHGGYAEKTRIVRVTTPGAVTLSARINLSVIGPSTFTFGAGESRLIIERLA